MCLSRCLRKAFTFTSGLRQQHEEDRAAGRIIFNPDRPLMRFDHGARDGETQSETLSLAFFPLLELVERVENLLLMRVLNAGAGVGNSNQRESLRAARSRNSSSRGLRHARQLAERAHVDADEPALARKMN